MGINTPKNLLLTFGRLTLDPTRHTLSRTMPEQNELDAAHAKAKISHAATGPLKLTPTEFRLLYFLFQNEGLAVARSEIQQNVWDSNTHIRSRAIDKHIHTLKTKLVNFEITIECIYGKGYRLHSKLTNANPSHADQVANRVMSSA